MSSPGKPDATLLRESLACHVIHSTDKELVIHIIDLGDQYQQQREKSRSRKLFTDVLPLDKIASIQTPTLTEYGICKEHVIESCVLSALLLNIIAVNTESFRKSCWTYHIGTERRRGLFMSR